MIVTAGAVRRAGEALLREHLPAKLAEMADAEGLPLPEPRSWSRLADFTTIAEHQSPAVVVTTPGISEVLPSAGCRAQVATWQLRVFVVVRGRTYEETADRVAAYTAAVRSVLLEARRLEGFSASVTWAGETYQELSADDARTVGAGSVTVNYPGVQTGTST